MKPQIGNANFNFITLDGRELEIEAEVYFDSNGEAESGHILILENGEEIDFETLEKLDIKAINTMACEKAVPQDEIYDEYESDELEFE